MSKEQIDMSSGGYGQSDTSDSKSRNPTIMKKDHQFRRVILLVYRSGAIFFFFLFLAVPLSLFFGTSTIFIDGKLSVFIFILLSPM